jgi:hypothetical protein
MNTLTVANSCAGQSMIAIFADPTAGAKVKEAMINEHGAPRKGKPHQDIEPIFP